MSHPTFFRAAPVHTARSFAARPMSGVVAGGKRAQPAFRQPPHHSSGEVPQALKRVQLDFRQPPPHSPGEVPQALRRAGTVRKTFRDDS